MATIKVCEAGLVKCVGEVVRGAQVIGFVHLNPFTGTYSIESARTAKTQHYFGNLELLQEFCNKERCRVDMHVSVEDISYTSVA